MQLLAAAALLHKLLLRLLISVVIYLHSSNIRRTFEEPLETHVMGRTVSNIFDVL